MSFADRVRCKLKTAESAKERSLGAPSERAFGRFIRDERSEQFSPVIYGVLTSFGDAAVPMNFAQHQGSPLSDLWRSSCKTADAPSLGNSPTIPGHVPIIQDMSQGRI
jgi:hypothetical protein